MNRSFDLAIIVPCYNEGNRLKVEQYKNFIRKHSNVLLYFVNDGSIDNTINLLNDLHQTHPSQTTVINLSKNVGKAETVRKGFLKCLKTHETEKIAYLDADLSTSLEACYLISKEVSITTHFAFASRIAKIDTTIHRKFYRFFIGRCIATLIANQLSLKIYDTQCGCKVFKSNLAPYLFNEPFISRWLFDVELFHRLIALYGRDQLKYLVKEIPLKSWHDTDDSRVPLTYFFKIWSDLTAIKRAYKKVPKQLTLKNETTLK